jgi:hypothetical protein
MIELAFNEMNFDHWISKCEPDNEPPIGAIENYVVSNDGQKSEFFQTGFFLRMSMLTFCTLN